MHPISRASASELWHGGFRKVNVLAKLRCNLYCPRGQTAQRQPFKSRLEVGRPDCLFSFRVKLGSVWSGASWLKPGLIGSRGPSAQSPPYSPRLTDALSQFPRPVPAAVGATQPQARRPFIPPRRKWPVLFWRHISTGPRKLLTRTAFLPVRICMWSAAHTTQLLLTRLGSFHTAAILNRVICHVLALLADIRRTGRTQRTRIRTTSVFYNLLSWIIPNLLCLKFIFIYLYIKYLLKTRQTYSCHCWPREKEKQDYTLKIVPK